MKKLLFTFLALMVLGTSAWGAGTETVLKRGVVKYERTVADIATTNKWSNGTKYSFAINDDLSWTSSNDNGNYNGTGLRIYQTRNTYASTISVANGLIDSISLDYVIATESGKTTYGILCTQASPSNPVPDAQQIVAKKTYKVNAASFSFYAGRTNSASSGNGRCDVTKFTVYYKKYPTAISLSDMTISVGNKFQLLPTPTPANAYPSYTWSSDNTSAVEIDANTGMLNAKAAGSANITITSINGKQCTAKITVVKNNYKSITDTIKSATTGTSYVTSVTGYAGDNNVLNWIMRNFRRNVSKGDKMNDGAPATRLGYSSINYIAYNNSDSYPAEGGVRRVSFQWKAANSVNPASFDVDNTGTPSPWIVNKTYLFASSTWQSVQTYTRDINMDKNVQFRITIPDSEGTVLTIGPITITPYLLYTTKTATATKPFINKGLIDNTDNHNITYTLEGNDGEAEIDAATGEVIGLKEGEVTVRATWGNVSTTYKYTTHKSECKAAFTTAVVTKSIGDDSFTNNTLTKSAGASDNVTYSSSNENVAKVNPTTGEVTIVNGGTTKISATIAEGKYLATTTFYTLDVTHTPTEPYFAESFDSISVGTSVSPDAPKVFGGNGGVYRWQWTNTQRLESEKIGTYQSPKIINNYGKIAMADVAEGGIKEVAFRYKTKNSNLRFHFYVKVGDKEVEMARVGSANVMSFAHQFNMDDSVGLSIYMKETDSPQQTHLLIDTVKIVPYLLYTQKVVAASAADGAYTNHNLINNTGTKPSYSISCSDDVATIDANGAVTIHKSDTVTVTATWNKVKTTYTLQMQANPIPEIGFAASSLEKDLLAGDFTNALTTPVGVGDTTYSSSNEDVATVDAMGNVTMHSIGEAKITVNIAESKKYAATSLSYDLTVGFAPVAGTYWKETYSEVPAVKNWTGTDKYEGDSSLYNWSMTFYQRQTDDMVDTYQGTRIRYSGALAMDGVQEGGIKAIRFDYRAANQSNPIHFKVNVDNADYEYNHAIIPVKGTIVSYARKFEAKKNTQFAITMDTQKVPQQGFPIVGPITITPYLLYTVKSMERKQEEGVFTNTALINNIDAGKVSYSVEGENADQIASIDSTGAVTILGEGVVTVKAAWGDVYTTYTLIAHTKTVPEISFAADTLNKDLLDAAFTNTLNAPEGVGAITYVSSNEDVATVDANGWVSMANTIGSAIITAYAAESEEYAADSAKFTVNVTYTPVAGKVWKETFSKRNPNSSKDMTPRPTVGDSAIYNWTLTNYDYNNTDNFDGVIGVRVRYDGSIVCDAMEGGIKAASFRWRASSNSNPIHFTVKADNEPVVVEHAIIPKGQPVEFPFVRKFAKTSNASFSIKVDTAGQPALAYIGCGPITITPYLLFKKFINKEVTLDLDKVTEFNLNDAIIDNTEGGTITFAIDSFKTDVTPTINAGVLDFTNVKKGGKVYVSAKWEDVATTLVISTTITPEVNFAEPTPAAQKLADGSYTNALVAPEGVGAITYTSSNTNVATVDNNGVVTFLVAGTTTITAKVAAKDSYKATEKSYDLTINGYTPAEGTAWVETFDSVKTTTNYISETTVNGKMAVYNWTLSQYARRTADKVGGTYQGIVIGDGNGIKTNDMEGGIKYISFDWSPKNSNKIDFTVQVGTNTPFEYVQASGSSSTKYTYERFVYEKTNANLAFKLANYTDKSANVTFGHITVVPYLLYTEKQASIKIGETYTNENLINNLEGADKTAVQYAIVEGNEYATIEGDELTGVKAGTVKVKAYLNDKLYTTYQLTVTEATTIDIDEDDEDLAILVNAYDGQKKDVTLRRAMTADGTYNTIYLPFALNEDQVTAVFGANAKVAELTSSSLDGNVLSLNFDFVTATEAGKPYLVAPTQDVSEVNVGQVAISKDEQESTCEGGNFHGILEPQNITMSDKYFLGNENKLITYTVITNYNTKGLRAYFTLNNPAPGVQARCVIGRGTTTVLPFINGEAVSGTKKMIIDSRLVIIRDGMMFNAQGARLK